MKRLLGLLLIAAVTLASAQDVTLKYKFTKGSVLRYKEAVTQSSQSEAMPGGQQLRMTRYTRMTVENTTADGKGTVVTSTDSSSTLMNDKPFSNPQVAAMEKYAYRLTIDATGKVLDAVVSEEPKDDAAKKLTTARAAQFKNESGFPAKALKVGETWDNSSTVNQDMQMGKMTVTTKTTMTYTGMEKVDGVDAAVIAVAGTISGEIGAGMGVISGRVIGKRYFAVKEGYELKVTADVEQSFDIQTPQGSMVVNQKMTQLKEKMK